eukprot:scaffold1909_cov130-Cylindrotheca_fusiformis.AAC.5
MNINTNIRNHTNAVMDSGMAEMISDAVLEKFKSDDRCSHKSIQRSENEKDFDQNGMNVTLKKIDLGVLSAVFFAEVIHGEMSKKKLPERWILKICRDDLDLRWMFRREAAFYTTYGPKLASDALPFNLTTALSASEEHIILKFVEGATCHSLVDGCPEEKIEFLVHAMACWHAQCWASELLCQNYPQIHTDPPGMGQRLSPLLKEQLFVANWRDTLHHMDFGNDSSLHEFAFDLCSTMSDLRLRDIHDIVHQHKVTCIHGDFHIANWLFPKDGSKPVLIDWTVWGYGNPMVDFAFFMVVSTNDQVASNIYPWLQSYMTTIKRHRPDLEHLSVDILNEWLGWALLCQWLVLVAYDGVCRGIANGEKDPIMKKSQLTHFNNVNRRATLALKSTGALDILKELPIASEEERKEAQAFAARTTLAI